MQAASPLPASHLHAPWRWGQWALNMPAAWSSPSHTGAEAVHAPEAVHRTSSGPTSTDPSSQAKLQLAWCGGPSAPCRQLMRPRSGGLRGGHRAAKNNHGQRVSSGKPRSLQQLPTSPGGGICLPE